MYINQLKVIESKALFSTQMYSFICCASANTFYAGYPFGLHRPNQGAYIETRLFWKICYYEKALKSEALLFF